LNIPIIENGKEEHRMEKFIYWVPRILGIGLLVFYALFALDAINEESSVGEMLLGLLIHLVPAFLLLAALLVAWKWEFPGGLLYLVLSALYVYLSRGMIWMVYLPIGGSLLLTGILFILHYSLFKKNKTA
jgi:hypothetical protein